jgi:type VI protein secretion system component VasK
MDGNQPLRFGAAVPKMKCDLLDRVMIAMAASFGLERQALAPNAASGRSDFITHLLQQVIFPEAELAGVNHALEQRRRMIQWGTVAALPAQGSTVQLLPVLDALRTLPGGYDDRDKRAPFLMRFGLYQGDASHFDAESVAGLAAHELALMENFRDGQAMSTLDPQQISDTRLTLARMPLEQRVYNRLKRQQMREKLLEFSPASAGGRDAANVQERWVLAQHEATQAGNRDQVRQAVLRLYYDDYIAQCGGLRLRPVCWGRRALVA